MRQSLCYNCCTISSRRFSLLWYDCIVKTMLFQNWPITVSSYTLTNIEVLVQERQKFLQLTSFSSTTKNKWIWNLVAVYMHEVIRQWKTNYVQKIVYGEKRHQFNDSDLTLQYLFHQIIDILFFYIEKNPDFFILWNCIHHLNYGLIIFMIMGWCLITTANVYPCLMVSENTLTIKLVPYHPPAILFLRCFIIKACWMKSNR